MASSGDKVYPTPAQLRAVGVWAQAEGLIAGLDYAEGYDAHELVTSATLSFGVTPESAREAHHDADDLSIEVQVPTVDSEDCSSHYTFNALNLAHRNHVSIYGPHPALTHESWSGSGGASAPTSGGGFTVAASGTPKLALNLPNNFVQIQADAPAENFPAGGPSVPESYWYHRADRWSAAYGAEGPKGGTWDATWEAVYCWRGWGWLLTRLTVPDASPLRLTVAGRTLTPVDNHYVGTDTESELNRQSGYEHSWTTWNFEAVPHMVREGVLVQVDEVPAGTDQHVYWLIKLKPDGEQVDPEVVETLELSGFADGTWQLTAPPTLELDPTTAGHARIKTFEAAAADGDEHHSGSGYRHGGLSAVVDYASQRMLYAGDNSNANVVEECLPMFDRQISPNYELDFTSAFTLGQGANIITWCSDAWECSLNTSAAAQALKDSDDNELGCWLFDVRESQLTTGFVPLEQDVDGGVATAALRCGSWEIALGIVCKVVTDKVIGGRMHGIAQKPLGTLARSRAKAAQVWRRYPDSGAFAKDGAPRPSDDAGHWRSANLDSIKEFDGETEHPWYYAATGGKAPTASDGLAPAREYLEASVTPAAEGRRHGMYTDPTGGVPHYCWIDGDGNIKFNRIVAGLNTPGTAVTVDDTGAYDSVACTSQGGVIYVTARSASGIDLFTSTDDGETWTGPTDVS
ncbi:MAG: hypothetical protein GYA36_22960 [Veillonellaceae bacterium]|nr:hypothetical protein [Veillonellaceae bacterium]